MKNNTWLVIAILIIAILLIYFNWDKIQGMTASGYDACIDKNKQLADGSKCGICVSDSSTIPSSEGIISQGICQPIQKREVVIIQRKLVVTNPLGARIYSYVNGNMVSPLNPQIISYSTQLGTPLQVIQAPGTYYRVSEGWVSASDVTFY